MGFVQQVIQATSHENGKAKTRHWRLEIGIHRWSVIYTYKEPVMQKAFSRHDVSVKNIYVHKQV